ncbi:uncharacterized protein LOC135195459 [Macrobrachium nipponense]|uniref:uncharacterized protein LOC135195459 n=1 Tax=Macrobrachium nipponense TaxID=159736 RepID=UPI0030C8432F
MLQKSFTFLLHPSRRKMRIVLISIKCIPYIIAAATGYIIAALGASGCNITPFEVLLSGPLPGDDPRLLSFIKSSLLVPPSTEPYNLKILETSKPSNVNYNSYLKSSVGFPPLHRVITQILGGRPPGFFVEAGALDGEWLSNTLHLEKDKGWQGLLVEPDRKMFAHLLQKNRRAWSANCCLSIKDYPVKEALVSISNPKGSGDDVGYRAMNTLSHQA